MSALVMKIITMASKVARAVSLAMPRLQHYGSPPCSHSYAVHPQTLCSRVLYNSALAAMLCSCLEMHLQSLSTTSIVSPRDRPILRLHLAYIEPIYSEPVNLIEVHWLECIA
jgi:hypothetical protein